MKKLTKFGKVNLTKNSEPEDVIVIPRAQLRALSAGKASRNKNVARFSAPREKLRG